MKTCKECKFCCGKPKPCLLDLDKFPRNLSSACGDYFAKDLYAWVHLKSVEIFQSGFELVGDKHEGTQHQFRFMLGKHFPDRREIVYNTTPGKMWGKVINDLGQQLEQWNCKV